jgi:hypothetical protein
MIGWGEIFYGAALTAVITAIVVVLIKRERSPHVLIPTLAAALLGPLAWNAILHRAGNASDGFFVDIPFKLFPVSWQDTGSGVFTLAVACVLLGLALRRQPAGRVLVLAVLAAAVAFIVDIYFY